MNSSSKTRQDIFTLLSLYYNDKCAPDPTEKDPHTKFNSEPNSVCFSELCRYYYGTGESFWERSYKFDRKMMQIFHNYYTNNDGSLVPLDFYLSVLAHIYDAILTSEMATVKAKEKVVKDYVWESIREQTLRLTVNPETVEVTFYDFAPTERHLFRGEMGMGDNELTKIYPESGGHPNFNVNWVFSRSNHEEIHSHILAAYNDNNSSLLNANFDGLSEGYFWFAHFRRVYSFPKVLGKVYGNKAVATSSTLLSMIQKINFT